MKTRLCAIPAFFISFAAVVWGDTLVLRNGQELPGQVVLNHTDNTVLIVEGPRSLSFPVTEVARIEFSREVQTPDPFGFGKAGSHFWYDAYRPDQRDPQPGVHPIEVTFQEMIRAGIKMGTPLAVEQDCSDGQGHYRVYPSGSLYTHPRTGTHEVHGSIREYYLRMGAENGRLGYPVSNEGPAQNGAGRTSTFEHGTISWSAETGARVEFGR